jgi:hypothetical protein
MTPKLERGLDFRTIKNAVTKQFKAMSTGVLFQTNIDKDLLWSTYLASFPPGTNPIFKTRTEHDCSCCRSFVKNLGGVVSIVDGRLVTIWDGHIGDEYQFVANAMAELVRGAAIDNLFLHRETTLGTDKNRELLEDQSVRTWEHYFVNLPPAVVIRDAGPKLSDSRATHDVLARSLSEITLDSIDTVLELIAQNSLYRGEEHKFALTEFRKVLVRSTWITGEGLDMDTFVWSQINGPASVTRIRNTVIGTLLTDLSEGKDLEDAVKAFEVKVAPTNYKRPTALVTKAMIQKAQEKVQELGLSSALERRYATIDDITVNNILFADRTAKKEMNVFEALANAAPVTQKSLDKVEEISISKFLENILPQVESLEILLENRHASNLVSLIAPVDPTAKGMFKWGNNFSWSYAGEVADSIKERVKKAGGNVTGDFRASLSWSNYDDLDLHLVEPGGETIYYGHKVSKRGGNLDVDMNAGAGTTRTPVENIVYSLRGQMLEGMYKLVVHNFARRETQDVGFDVEMEFEGTVNTFSHPAPLPDKKHVDVVTFKYSHKNGIEIIKSLPSAQSTKTVWGIPTQTYHKVRIAMLSPNYWDTQSVGNKHYFFMLDGCLNEGKARGFFNEFLSETLAPHRKVLEVVGAKMKTEESDKQLSGLGFSSTQRNHLFCRVQGAFTRVVKITF